MDFIVVLWHLILMRATPQQLPAYTKLLILSCAFMVSMGILSGLATGLAEVNLLETFVDLFFLLAFLKVLLWLFRFPMRFTQTATAITGSIALFSVLFIPLNFVAADFIGFNGGLNGEVESQMQSSPAGAVIALIYLALFIWMLRVLGHIFLHALEVRLPFAIGIAMLYLMSSLFVSLTVL